MAIYEALLSWFVTTFFKKQITSLGNFIKKHRYSSFVLFSLIMFFAFLIQSQQITISPIKTPGEIKGISIKLHFLGMNNNQAVQEKLEKDPIVALNPDILGLKNVCENLQNCYPFEEENWNGWGAFGKNKDNPKILHVTSENFNNPSLFLKNVVPGLLFDFEVQARPLDKNKGNIVIAQNKNWRCIIAEANYKAITCETSYNETESKKRFTKHFSDLKKDDLKSGTNLIISGSTRINSDNKIDLALIIDYIDKNDNKEKAEFNFILPLTNADLLQKSQFGVGIIDPKKEGIEVEFIYARITPRN